MSNPSLLRPNGRSVPNGSYSDLLDLILRDGELSLPINTYVTANESVPDSRGYRAHDPFASVNKVLKKLDIVQ